MEHTYKITGISCNSCRAKVEKTLNAIEGVSAEVILGPSQAIITMLKHIPTGKFQAALSAVGNYAIEMQGHHQTSIQGNPWHSSNGNGVNQSIHII